MATRRGVARRLTLLRRRTGTPADLLVVGLGNPGDEYAGTRHNVGAEVVALLAAPPRRPAEGRARSARSSPRSRIERPARRAGRPAHLHERLGPGRARRSCAASASRTSTGSWSSTTSSTCPPARCKVKLGGGLAGHNGLRSIKAHLHTDDFVRIRIGVGKPPGGKEQGADHVLKRPGKRERTELRRGGRGGGRRRRGHRRRRRRSRDERGTTAEAD